MIHPEQVIEMLKPTGTATATWVPGPAPTTIPTTIPIRTYNPNVT